MKIGVQYRGKSRYTFVVWAPFQDDVALTTLSPDKRVLPMHRDNFGYWCVEVNSINPETCCVYRIGEQSEHPDPASFFQPHGVHGPTQVVDHTLFHWEDRHWKGISIEKMLMYELHVGAFTPEGTFEAIIPRLGDLCELGINAINIMPVAQFPDERLSNLVSFEALKLAAGTVLFSPYKPLVFMGEEYGEEAPFLYFVDHSDQELIKAVREERKRELEAI